MNTRAFCGSHRGFLKASRGERVYASLFSSAGLNNMSASLGQENNKLYFFLHALIGPYEQASSHTS